MERIYETPEMEVITFNGCDVITESRDTSSLPEINPLTWE